jgi:hypothetical protein
MLRRLPAFAKHILQKEAVIPSGIAAPRSWDFLLRFQNLNPEIARLFPVVAGAADRIILRIAAGATR